MEQIIITRDYGFTWPLLTKAAMTVVTKAEQRKTLMGENIVAMSVESAVKLDFNLRDYITVFGEKYFLNAIPKFVKNGVRKFAYEIIWEGRQYDLLKPFYLDEDIDGVSISPDFSLTGTLELFMDVLINNANRIFGSGFWVLGDCPETDYKTLTFSNEKCLAVLQRLCKDDCFRKEFEIIETTGHCTINIKEEIGETLTDVYEYGKGKGLYNLTRNPVSEKEVVTRLYVFGSNKNLQSDYRGYSQRLKLPENDLSYIQDSGKITEFGLNEGVKIFEDIYPHRTGTVTSLGDSTEEFLDSSMDFDLKAVDESGNTLYLIAGMAAKIHFNTGNLAGYEFGVEDYDHATKKFKILPFTDERGQMFPDPNSSAFQVAATDEYVILDIRMPDSYITAAETALQTAGDAWYELVSRDRLQYSQTFDELYFKQKYEGEDTVNVFAIGDYVPIKDTDLGVDRAIRLKSFKRDVQYLYRYNLDLYDYSEEALVNKLIAANGENSRVIASSIRNSSNVTYNQKAINDLLKYFVLMDLGTDNPYLRAKLPLAGDLGIKSYAASAPGSMWLDMPFASASVVGGIKTGSGLSIDAVTGIASVSFADGGIFRMGNYTSISNRYSAADTWIGQNAYANSLTANQIQLTSSYIALGAAILNIGFQGLYFYQWSAADLAGKTAGSVLTLPTVSISVSAAGALWIKDNCSALSFTDRTPFYEGDALSEIMLISGKDGEIDHGTLPEFVRREYFKESLPDKEPVIESDSASILVQDVEAVGQSLEVLSDSMPELIKERDLGAMISMLTVAVQQIGRRLEALENKN